MKNFDNQIKESAACFIDILTEYYEELIKSKSKEQKTCIAQYYTYCCRIDTALTTLDELTENISNEIFEADNNNRYDEYALLSVWLDNALTLRKIIESFMFNSEVSVKSKDGNFLYELKRQTDISIRKLTLFLPSV